MKPNAIGSFVLVLHGHLPYVMHHGVWPHGEDWLYEAAAETYLPLLAMLDECVFLKATPKMTVGLTPVLLEQLVSESFQRGFEAYLGDRVERAKADAQEFDKQHEGHLAHLARLWQEFYGKLGEQFRAIQRNIPAAFAEFARRGLVEILTSNATHAYMPLMLEDSTLRAQMRAGVATSQRILGFKPRGMWLPECAYRPSGPWQPPISWGGKRDRTGIEHVIADEGVAHFFVEHKLIEASRSEWVIDHGNLYKVGWDEATKYPGRGWRSVHEAHAVNSDGTGPGRATVLARDPRICEQVWSGTIGYPANGVYLEFHKKQGARRGLRYWKVTGKGVDLGQKAPYYPDDVPGKIFEHARHFCDRVKQRLREYRGWTGRHGAVVAAFDAELFGHWWFEGPRFLRDVLLTLSADPEIELCTAQEFIEQHPPDKVVSLPEGSWGEGGDHRVWCNDRTAWIWEVEYRAEALFGKLTYTLAWRDPKNVKLREMLEMAGRELLLMQASDWPFVISRGQAIDYGIKRFVLHAGRFENLCDMAEKTARGEELTDLERFEIEDAARHDTIFPKIDLNWWNL
jgi:1,4-alpha-glucan branching enzyme